MARVGLGNFCVPSALHYSSSTSHDPTTARLSFQLSLSSSLCSIQSYHYFFFTRSHILPFELDQIDSTFLRTRSRHILNMKVIIMMILSVLASFFSFPSVDAKCCRAFTTCGDGTEDYTCCGYGKCNGFCCSCDGGKSLLVIITPQPNTFLVVKSEHQLYAATSPNWTSVKSLCPSTSPLKSSWDTYNSRHASHILHATVTA